MSSIEAEISQQIQDTYGIDPSEIYSITELCRDINQILSNHPKLNNVLLRGEITNFSRAASGHIYFSLKDEISMIACAYFKNEQDEDLDLNNGIQVVALGSVTTYEPRSQYQVGAC
jgi:exodeoxyribonuclease VII large subunit